MLRCLGAEVARASGSSAPWTPPWGGVPGMSPPEGGPEEGQDTLEGRYPWVVY